MLVKFLKLLSEVQSED